MALTADQLIAEIETMTVLDLANLVKALEDQTQGRPGPRRQRTARAKHQRDTPRRGLKVRTPRREIVRPRRHFADAGARIFATQRARNATTAPTICDIARVRPQHRVDL